MKKLFIARYDTNMKLSLGHSPDSDDAFMFWALAKNKVNTHLEFEHILKDIQTLNQMAQKEELDFTAVSVHAFAYLADKYAVLIQGGSFGEGYGPRLVALESFELSDIQDKKIAVPGLLTSAYLSLCLWWDDQFPGTKPNVLVVPFDEIMDSVRKGQTDVGLLIHEGQLTYAQEGFQLLLDLGAWWKEKTGLPLPLGINILRKALGQELMEEVATCFAESIALSMKHRADALEYAKQFGRGIDDVTNDTFVQMYVNERTLDMGNEGRKAIELFLAEGVRLGLIPEISLDFVHAKHSVLS